MNALNGWYFDPYALSYLTQFILILIIAFYFLRTMTRTDLAWPSLLFFCALAASVGVELMGATAVWVRQFYALQLRYVMLYLALLAFISRVYHFPLIPQETFAQSTRRERKFSVSLAAIAFAISVGWAVFQTSQLRVGGHPSINTQLLDTGLALGVFWMLLVLVRRMVRLARDHGSGSLGWRVLSEVQQRPARDLVRFVGIGILAVTMSGSMALTTIGVVPLWWREIVPTAGQLLLIFCLATYNFDASLHRSTFLGRIIGITLLGVFLILGLMGIVLARNYRADIHVWPDIVPSQTLRFIPQPSGAYMAFTLPYQPDPEWGQPVPVGQMALPFAFPFPCCTPTRSTNLQQSSIQLGEEGVIGFGNGSKLLFAYNYQPAIIAYQRQPEGRSPLFVKAAPDRLTVTWPGDEVDLPAQVVLYASGRFDLNLPPLPGDRMTRMGFQSGTGGTDFTPFEPAAVYAGTPIAADGLLVDYAILARQSLHRTMIPLVALALAVSVLSMVGFPLLFRIVLMRPLNALVRGVREVNSGNLAVEVPIFYEDEFGIVARSFNQMVRTVQNAENRLAAKVDIRTRELAESQRQLGAAEERERIGREIHDDLGQVMGYVHMQLSAAMARMQQHKNDQAQAILTEVDQVALEAHDRVRQYILGIRTAKKEMQTGDFWTTLDEYVAVARERYGLTIELTADDGLRGAIQLTAAVETQLLRIIQEGLSNVYKHANATSAHLILAVDQGMLTLLLRDNGRGFAVSAEGEAEDTSDQGHFGLTIMQERVYSINGDLQISSAPGQGTRLQIRVPYIVAAPGESAGDGVVPSWRVMLVDDHALFREGLGNMLRPYGIQVVGAAESGKEAEALVADLQPDLILMDLHMAEQDGLETTRRIKARFPQIKIVMLTMASEESALLQSLKAGASGYLLKSMPTPQFLSLLQDVMAGKMVIAPELAARALTALAQQERSFPPNEGFDGSVTELTERQQEVLACVAQGMNNRAVADLLHISESTVKYHINQILQRLRLETRHDLIRYHAYATNAPQTPPRAKD